jgi:hypothetical protein
VKIYAYYLPQFHCIPENDEWWGKGFTEWTNVRKAKPLFKNHKQPVHPYNDYYYRLDDPNTLRWQAKLASDYKVDGMIFYHYYFAGKKLLEKPAELLLQNKDIPMNFFFCWANHSWYRTWEGSKTLLMEQVYGSEDDWEQHFQYLLPFFLDNRYEKRNNKPLLLLFKCDFPEKKAMFEYFNRRCLENGFSGICVIESFNYSKDNKFKSFEFKMAEFRKQLCTQSEFVQIRQPDSALDLYRNLPSNYFSRLLNILGKQSRKLKIKYVEKYDGEKLFETMIKKHYYDDDIINGLFMRWDNTSRHGLRGYLITPPQKSTFMNYLECVKDEEYLFVNAWNEWCEGMMLEPTVEEGFKYLEWIKEFKTKN